MSLKKKHFDFWINDLCIKASVTQLRKAEEALLFVLYLGKPNLCV